MLELVFSKPVLPSVDQLQCLISAGTLEFVPPVLPEFEPSTIGTDVPSPDSLTLLELSEELLPVVLSVVFSVPEYSALLSRGETQDMSDISINKVSNFIIFLHLYR
tara:strand:+ start:244 stop:561 length:318 start_codon:yes stop_codon:yes gene_type:complete